jgi:hypothetical protein
MSSGGFALPQFVPSRLVFTRMYFAPCAHCGGGGAHTSRSAIAAL